MAFGGVMAHPSVAVLEHYLVSYRRTWRGTVFSSVLLPVLFLLSLGLSVGSYVDRSGTLDARYIDYIAPALGMVTAMQLAVAESTWPVMTAFQWSRIYHAMRASPLRIRDIVAGHVGYVLVRVLLSATIFLVVMLAFGTLHSVWAIATVAVAGLVGLATAAPVFAYAATVTDDSMFAVLFRLVVYPMSLFAGVFFPVSSLPEAVRWLAYASPLWHGVELSRAATLGTSTAWGAEVHVGYLLVWVGFGWVLAVRQFTRRLAT